ncbi:MAG: DUF4369 domain-containing protein [Flavobacteriaceae bacterium]|jgi:hypothetical protein|nr:DUF4369 domain-containing protein [Flavobacteriaceae bacterium]
MKKIIFALLIAGGALFTACNKDSKSSNLTVTGKIDGLKQGKVYLHQIRDTAYAIVDSVIVNGTNSNFNFKLNIESPEVFFLTLDRGHSNSIDNQLMFFAEPGQMTINTTLSGFYKDAVVTGSKNNDLFNEYIKSRTLIVDKQNDLIVEIFNAEKANDLTKKDSLLAVNRKLLARRYLNAVNFAVVHKDADVAPYIALTELYDRNIKYLDTVYNSLTPEILKNKYAKDLGEFIKERKTEEQKNITTQATSETN